MISYDDALTKVASVLQQELNAIRCMRTASWGYIFASKEMLLGVGNVLVDAETGYMHVIGSRRKQANIEVEFGQIMLQYSGSSLQTKHDVWIKLFQTFEEDTYF